MIRKALDFVALDLETTGLDPANDCIIEIGAVKYIEGKRDGSFSAFVNPKTAIPARITAITGIDDSMVAGAPPVEEALAQLFEFVGKMPLLGHNILFDYSFLRHKAADIRMNYTADGIDTHRIAKKLLPQLESRSLECLCGYYHIEEEPRHRAFSDAAAAARLYDCLFEEAGRRLYGGGSTEQEAAVQDCDKLFGAQPLIYTVKKDSPITQKQAAFLKKLIGQHHINYEKEIESLTKSQASKEIDRILFVYGRS